MKNACVFEVDVVQNSVVQTVGSNSIVIINMYCIMRKLLSQKSIVDFLVVVR